MGQKVNPISFRIGFIEKHRSRWYATKKDFGTFLVEDHKLRRFIKKNYAFAGIPKIEIERTRENVIVIIHTASPGVIIGRRGAKVDKLTEDLQALIGHKVELKIIEIDRPELCAQLVAESICEQLNKRSPYRRTIRKAAELGMQNGAKGVRVNVAGRIGGAEIARSEKILLGSIPLHKLRANIDYGFAEALTVKGKIGCKVWIYKGEVLDHKSDAAAPTTKETPIHATDAQKGQVSKIAKRQDKR